MAGKLEVHHPRELVHESPRGLDTHLIDLRARAMTNPDSQR